MPQSGIDVTRVDATAQYPVGYEQEDPRGGAFSGNKVKYCRANGSIPVNSAVKADVTFATAAERHATVIVTAGAGSFEGVSDCVAVTVTAGQFFWITTYGLAIALTASTTAGTAQGTAAAGGLTDLTTVTSAQAVGKTAIAMSATGTPVANKSYVLLR
jgi:hypothetical protein